MDAYFQNQQVFGHGGGQNYYDRRGNYAGRSTGGLSVRNVSQAFCRSCVVVKMDTYLTDKEKKALLFVALAVVAGLLIYWLATSIPRLSNSATTSQGDSSEQVFVPGGELDIDFDSFDAYYILERFEGGASALTATEIVVANFPNADVHRGYIRFLRNRHLGQNLNTNVQLVTDQSGNAREWQTYSDETHLRIDAVAPNGAFARGRQVYQIDYTMQNVVSRQRSSEGYSEFYWVVNDVDSSRPWGDVAVRVFIDEDSARGVDLDSISCYVSTYESQVGTCQIEYSVDAANRLVVDAKHRNMPAYHTMIIDIRFKD